MTILYTVLFLFAVRCALEQSASGSRRLPLPPPGLSHEKRKRKKEREKERERVRERLKDDMGERDRTTGKDKRA